MKEKLKSPYSIHHIIDSLTLNQLAGLYTEILNTSIKEKIIVDHRLKQKIRDRTDAQTLSFANYNTFKDEGKTIDEKIKKYV